MWNTDVRSVYCRGLVRFLAGPALLLLLASASATAQDDAVVMQRVLGEQKLLVIPVKFSTNLSEPFTLQEISQRIFGEVDAYYRDVSLGRTWFSGAVTPWVTVTNDPAFCGSDVPLAIAAAAKAEVGKLGYQVTDYDRFLYVVPALNCSWAGVAGVGSPESWYRSISFHVVVHELGHGFGLRHAHSAVCQLNESWSWPAGCANYEYGDKFDVMAGSDAAFNALHQRRMGYLDTDPRRATTLVESSGDYRIGIYANADLQSRALRIPAGVDAASGLARTIYVTRRAPVGRDAVLGSDLAMDQNRVRNGIVIHIGLEASGDGALIDATPLSRTGMADMQDAPLLVGEVYVDPATGIIVSPVAVEPNVATVAVTLGPSGDPGTTPTDNQPPLARDDFAKLEAGKTKVIPVLNNDSDPDNHTLTVTKVGNPRYGSVSVDSNGLPLYRAPRKFKGVDSFDYEISDGRAYATAMVTVTVTASSVRIR